MHKFIQISSGRGPEECEFAALKIMEIFIRDARKNKIKTSVIEINEGAKKNTIKSALISIEDNNLNSFLTSWTGTVLWICKSPFRPEHKRKNWYVKISSTDMEKVTKEFSKNDIKIETMKSSGPGGQHVNTTDSGVRITYIPENIVVTAKEERSQHLNKKLAFLRLEAQLEKINEKQTSDFIQKNWNSHNSLERGNPVKTFTGKKFMRS